MALRGGGWRRLALSSPGQRLSQIGCNKIPPSVSFVLAGERAAVIDV